MAYEPEQPHDPEAESWSLPFEPLLPEEVSMIDDPLRDADSEPSGPSFALLDTAATILSLIVKGLSGIKIKLITTRVGPIGMRSKLPGKQTRETMMTRSRKRSQPPMRSTKRIRILTGPRKRTRTGTTIHGGEGPLL
jgi:hypothetical protein